MITTYFQALGRAQNSLLITVLRNIILFIPGTIALNALFQLNGVVLTQLVVEVILSVICVTMYLQNAPRKMAEREAQTTQEHLSVAVDAV